MLKKYFVLLLLVGSFQVANSQVLISIILGDKLNSPDLEFGLDGGFNFSQITGLESKAYASDLHLGFYFDFRLKEQWWLNTGVLVKSSMGASSLTQNDVLTLYPNFFEDFSNFPDSGNYSQSLGSFNVPVMLKYRFKNHFYVEAGTQMSIIFNARLRWEHEYEGIELETSGDNISSFNKFDMGLIGSVGYKLRKGNGMNVGLKYYYGLLDISKNPNSYNTNNVFYIKVDIPIGKEKVNE